MWHFLEHLSGMQAILGDAGLLACLSTSEWFKRTHRGICGNPLKGRTGVDVFITSYICKCVRFIRDTHFIFDHDDFQLGPICQQCFISFIKKQSHLIYKLDRTHQGSCSRSRQLYSPEIHFCLMETVDHWQAWLQTRRSQFLWAQQNTLVILIAISPYKSWCTWLDVSMSSRHTTLIYTVFLPT